MEVEEGGELVGVGGDDVLEIEGVWVGEGLGVLGSEVEVGDLVWNINVWGLGIVGGVVGGGGKVVYG